MLIYSWGTFEGLILGNNIKYKVFENLKILEIFFQSMLRYINVLIKRIHIVFRDELRRILARGVCENLKILKSITYKYGDSRIQIRIRFLNYLLEMFENLKISDWIKFLKVACVFWNEFRERWTWIGKIYEQSSEYSTIWFFESQVFSYLCVCNTQNFEQVSIEIFVYNRFSCIFCLLEFCPIGVARIYVWTHSRYNCFCTRVFLFLAYRMKLIN